jgi:hypothetical protein
MKAIVLSLLLCVTAFSQTSVTVTPALVTTKMQTDSLNTLRGQIQQLQGQITQILNSMASKDWVLAQDYLRVAPAMDSTNFITRYYFITNTVPVDSVVMKKDIILYQVKGIK